VKDISDELVILYQLHCKWRSKYLKEGMDMNALQTGEEWRFYCFQIEWKICLWPPGNDVQGTNQGAMFPTWFRLLTHTYLTRYFSVEGFHILSGPGLEI
jgi:hypothetical protein